MTTVTLSVASFEDVRRRARAAFDGKAQGAHISFASPELLWKVLTAKRWELLKAMTGEGGMTFAKRRGASGGTSRPSMAISGRCSTRGCSIAPRMAA